MQLEFGSEKESTRFIYKADKGRTLQVIHTSQGDLENMRESAKKKPKNISVSRGGRGMLNNFNRKESILVF